LTIITISGYKNKESGSNFQYCVDNLAQNLAWVIY